MIPRRQGDLALLDTELARRLLASTIPARFAYTGQDGTPRIVPTWFTWTGDQIVTVTYVSGPVRHPAQRLAALAARPDVAITIDTEGFPPEALSIRGRAVITTVDGVAPEYEACAHRYLGDDAGSELIRSIPVDGLRMARIAVRPRWVGLLDFEHRFPSAQGGIS
jgi:hypothetical protein